MSHGDTTTERRPYPLENELRYERIVRSVGLRVSLVALTILAMVSMSGLTWLTWLDFGVVIFLVFEESLTIWFFPHRWVYTPLNDLVWLLAEYRIARAKGKVVKWKRVGTITLVYEDGKELDPFSHIPNDGEYDPLLLDSAGERDLPPLL